MLKNSTAILGGTYSFGISFREVSLHSMADVRECKNMSGVPMS
jgi:hypothetical protein